MRAPVRIILGISGASGAAIAFRIAERLAALPQVELHLVVSPSGERTLAHEVGGTALERLTRLSTHVHPIADIGASIASGSFRAAGMIVAPCSMRTLGAIATSNSDNLLVRAADVQLKERRRLVLMVRESPLHLGHLRLMVAASEIGAIIAPPMPAFYLHPDSISAMIDQMAGRAIDLLGLDLPQQAIGWLGESGLLAHRAAHWEPVARKSRVLAKS